MTQNIEDQIAEMRRVTTEALAKDAVQRLTAIASAHRRLSVILNSEHRTDVLKELAALGYPADLIANYSRPVMPHNAASVFHRIAETMIERG